MTPVEGQSCLEFRGKKIPFNPGTFTHAPPLATRLVRLELVTVTTGSQPACDIVMKLAVAAITFRQACDNLPIPSRQHHRKLYCLVTEAYVCERLAQSRYLATEHPQQRGEMYSYKTEK